MGKKLFVAVLLTVMFCACGGGGNGVTEPPMIPEPGPGTVQPEKPSPAVLPNFIYGAFAASEDVPAAAANGGNVVLVIPSYVDDPKRVAAALQANGKVAIVSAHHVFGNPRDTWGIDPSPQAQTAAARPRTYQFHGNSLSSVGGWPQTRAWMAELEKFGLVAGILVVDEPLHNGISAALRDEAVAFVRAQGFRTVVTEWVEKALQNEQRPAAVDYYGITCYDWSGSGGWSQSRCLTAYRDRPGWNLVIGQAFDLHPRNGEPQVQVPAWAKMAKENGKAGVLYWVWQWPGQVGIADDSEILAAYRLGWSSYGK